MEGEEASIHFNCFVHYPSFTEEGLEVENVAKGNGIELHPSTQLSSLAASVLSEMFQKQEIDGKVIMKADNAKGQWRCFFFLYKNSSFYMVLTLKDSLSLYSSCSLLIDLATLANYSYRSLAMSN